MIALAFAASVLVATLHAQEAPPAILEIALAERACDLTLPKTAPAPDRSACADAQLAALRADFGANLARLSADDRRKLDAACGGLSTTLARERYLDCVNAQLATVRERLRRSKPAGDATTAAPPAPTESTVAAPPAPAPPPSRAGVILAAGIAVVAIAGAAAFVMTRRRTPTPTCKSCGAAVTGQGELCAACRRQAADSLRQQAAAARAAEEAEVESRRRHEADEAARRDALRADAEARQAAALREAQERDAAERARRERDGASQREETEAPDAGASPFDAYALLGVGADASPDTIRAAYEAAIAKYDPDQVSHLSAEVQQHYRDKRDAVERAFQMLSGV